MEQNVGSKERMLCVGLGVVAGLAALKYRRSKLLSGLLASAAASVVKSGVSGYCPMKSKLGLKDSSVNSLHALSQSRMDPVAGNAQSGAI